MIMPYFFDFLNCRILLTMIKAADSGKPRHYFDWAATAPLFQDDNETQPGVFGNPSSLHHEGKIARAALEDARSRAAAVLGVKPETLYFTSGGTESNTLVLFSFLARKSKGRLLFSAVEHPSIRENCFALERFGITLGTIGVEKDGRLSRELLGRCLEKYTDARFAAIMAVNNEIGALMDMKAISALIRERENAPIHLHCDLVQAVGKVPIDINGSCFDSASISAHKLGGPRGIGLLYLRKPLEALIAGAQERGMRPGTENTAAAMEFASILEKRATSNIVIKEHGEALERFSYLINSLKAMKRCTLIPEDREEIDERFSPWIIQARFKGLPGEVMLRALDSEGFAVSTGSACSSSAKERPVLSAIGLGEEASLEGIRISQGWTTTIDDIKALVSGIEKILDLYK